MRPDNNRLTILYSNIMIMLATVTVGLGDMQVGSINSRLRLEVKLLSTMLYVD